MIKHFSIAILLAVSTCFLMGRDALASNYFGVPDSYSGLSADGKMLIDASLDRAKFGVLYYYRLHGAWPQNWRAVEEDGLVTASLTTPDGKAIDLDDGKTDFQWDIRYEYRGSNTPRFIESESATGQHEVVHEIEQAHGNLRLQTFAEILEKIKSKQSLEGQKHNLTLARCADSGWLKSFAAACVMQQLMEDYWLLKGNVGSWADFRKSAFFPQSDSAIDSLTGRPWAADGTPNSLVWTNSTGAGIPPRLWILDKESGLKICVAL
jgi:hypothetical protein